MVTSRVLVAQQRGNQLEAKLDGHLLWLEGSIGRMTTMKEKLTKPEMLSYHGSYHVRTTPMADFFYQKRWHA
jgi:hypothetical protein